MQSFRNMFKSRRTKSRQDKTKKRKSGRNKPSTLRNKAKPTANPRPAAAGLPLKRDMAELLLTKMPTAPDFNETLEKIVFKEALTEANKDVLRLIRRVVIKKRGENAGEMEEISFAEAENGGNVEMPEEAKEDVQLQSVYLFMVFLETLIDYFETQERAQQLKDDMRKLYTEDRENFNISSLIEASGGEESSSALVIKCLAQSVVITGYTLINCNVCAIPTKDVGGMDGWKISITLAEYVQVKHTKRGQAMRMPPNVWDWQVEFDVSVTFDRKMTEMTNANLAVTDLDVEMVEDEDFKAYLKEKFGNGSLTIC